MQEFTMASNNLQSTLEELATASTILHWSMECMGRFVLKQGNIAKVSSLFHVVF
jgi:hypothetical protein